MGGVGEGDRDDDADDDSELVAVPYTVGRRSGRIRALWRIAVCSGLDVGSDAGRQPSYLGRSIVQSMRRKHGGGREMTKTTRHFL